MKFDVHFKTPDAILFATQDAVAELDPDPIELEEYWDGDVDAWRENQRELLEQFTAQWVRHSECVVIEFDTVAGTATVRTVK